jgi:hypothetical protein
MSTPAAPRSDHGPRHRLGPRAVAVSLTVALLAGGCGADAPVGVDETFVLGSETASVGVAGGGAELHLPAGSFPDGTELHLTTGGEVATFDGDLAGTELVGTVAAVTVSDPIPRSDEPLTVTLRFDPALVQHAGELRIAYHHEAEGWTLWRPDTVDLDTGTASFATYHFSRFGPARIVRQRQADEYLERLAVEEYVRGDLVDAADAQIEEAVRRILTDAVGVTDSRVLEILARAVIEELPGGSLATSIYDLDPDAFAERLAAETADVLTEMITGADSEAARYLVSPDTAGTLGDVGGAASAGDAQRVAELVAAQVIGNTPVLAQLAKIGQTAREVGRHLVDDVWGSAEVEKAFLAYRDGAAGGWFGYDIDAGDWDGLLAQMRGIEAKLRTDAVRSWAAARGIAEDDLSAEERRRIGDEGLAQLRERFDDRIAREPEIERIRAANAELYGTLAEHGYLEPSPDNPLYGGEGANDEVEFYLGRLARMVEQVKRDTGRSRLLTNEEFESRPSSEAELSTLAVSQAIRAWYGNPPEERAEAYRQVLIAHGLLGPDDPVGLGGTDLPPEDAPDEETEEAEETEEPETGRSGDEEAWAAIVCPLYEQMLEAPEGWLWDEAVAGEGRTYIEISEAIAAANEEYDIYDYSLCTGD